MTAARVHLRYRPASDVLSGDIELSTLDADGPGQVDHARASGRSVAESPDADSHLEWQHSELDDTEYLTGFQIVHASARLEAGTLPALPAAIVPLARELMQSGIRTLASSTSALARMQAKVEVVVQLTPQQLARSAPTELTVPASWTADRTQLAEVDIILRRLAATLHELAATVSDRESTRTEHLARLLLELASVLTHARGTPSPGTTAAARRAVRGGLPLANSERNRLRAALGQLDVATSWTRAIVELTELCDALAPSGRPPSPDEGRRS